MKKTILLFISVLCCIMLLGGCVNRSPVESTPASPQISLLPTPTPTIAVPPVQPSVTPAKEEGTAIARGSDEAGQFKPIGKNEQYGMILMRSSELPLKGENNKASVELFVKAEQANGKIAWNDGQSWYLIVRDGNAVFKLLDNVYVQNGQVNYWAYWSYDEGAPSLLVMVQQGAGIEEYSFAYDKDKDAFYKKTVFKTEGNIGVTGSSVTIS